MTDIIELLNDEPHSLLISGGVGSGKMNLIHNYIINLILNDENVEVNWYDPYRVETYHYKDVNDVNIIHDEEDLITCIHSLHSLITERYNELNLADISTFVKVYDSRVLIIENVNYLNHFDGLASLLEYILEFGNCVGVYLIIITTNTKIETGLNDELFQMELELKAINNTLKIGEVDVKSGSSCKRASFTYLTDHKLNELMNLIG